MFSSKEIRQQFIDFFTNKGHVFVKSSPVVPADDPTLLFTNAGMNQFKDIFLGKQEPQFPSVVNSQVCIRAGGKHNDLDEVGKDGYHHTLFEMLGNWSFGHYYKKEAIKWAWELLTEIWHLPKTRLYATVHESDDEAYSFWKTETDIEHTHISKHGDKDNFWEMGEVGPCGPSSEIHIDMGKHSCNLDHEKDHVCGVNGECHRYLELWNLVFMQYLRNTDRSLTPLKSKYVDTGAGFERLCRVLQGADSNYETDVFSSIINEIKLLNNSTLAKTEETKEQSIAYRVIADHIRTLCFAIAEGCIPSNEGRGYVIRRILRRAAGYGRKINLSEPFLYRLVDAVSNQMSDYFDILKNQTEFVKTIIKTEEIKFNQTLDKGLSLFDELKKKLDSNVISGKEAFLLHDTYGFPLDFTKILADENGFTVDENGFVDEMEKQKQRARNASNFKLQLDDLKWVIFNQDLSTKFLGYSANKCEASILRYAFVDETEVRIILDKTVLYAEAGGQISDRGTLFNDDTVINVFNVQKEGDVFVHYGHLAKGKITNQQYMVKYNSDFREKIIRNHTATHLLHAILKDVLGPHVQQKGSMVTNTGLRFDFMHTAAMTRSQIRIVEKKVNYHIRNCTMLKTSIENFQEAKRKGAVALFGEKYGDKVRVVSIGNISTELCGGVHVHKTGQIGYFKIVSEGSIASGVRRIEAVTGSGAVKHALKNEATLSKICDLLSANETNVIEKIEKIIEDNKSYRYDIDILKTKNSSLFIDELVLNAVKINSIKCVYKLLTVSNTTELKTMGDLLKEKIISGIGVLVSEIEGKVTILSVVTNDLITKLSAGNVVSKLAVIVDGKGGGRADLAMAGGKAIDKIGDLMNEIPNVLLELTSEKNIVH